MLKAPTPVLQSFITAITEEKELSFSMAHWFNREGISENKPKDVKNVGGTSACIAGTVAFRMDPKSTDSCTAMIMRDIGVRVSNGWGHLSNDATLGEQAVEEALDRIFTNSNLYGVPDGNLDEVTQDMVLEVLGKLVESNFSTWEELDAELEAKCDWED